MLKMGITDPSYSASVIVRKKNGEHRFFVDYRGLNSVTKTDAEVMPNIEEPYVEIAAEEKKFFTKID